MLDSILGALHAFTHLILIIVLVVKYCFSTLENSEVQRYTQGRSWSQDAKLSCVALEPESVTALICSDFHYYLLEILQSIFLK